MKKQRWTQRVTLVRITEETALGMESQPSGALTPHALPTVDTYPWPFLPLFSYCVTIDTTIMNLFLKLQNGVKFPKLVSFYCSLLHWLLLMGWGEDSNS